MKRAPERPTGQSGIPSCRPTISARRHAISAGHSLAAQAGFQILEAGGNAVDAGVAAGLALGVVQSDIVNVAGVAPIVLFDAESRKVFSISGLGRWPQALTRDLFTTRHGGTIPTGLLRTVVPAAPDAWILALERWGTMRFADVAQAAIGFARDGFAVYPLFAEIIETFAAGYRSWPSNAAIYLPNGRPPKVGERFVQSDLARSMQYMVDEEKAASAKGRAAGLAAARAAFYTGDIGRAIIAFHEQNGGLLRMSDLATFRSRVEDTISVPFGGFDVHTCGFWCQGPVLAQMLRLVEAAGVLRHAHNSLEYVHGLAEIIKLCFADRHAYYGDSDFVDVPVERLMSRAYAEERATLIRPNEAWREMPPAGLGAAAAPLGPVVHSPQLPLDTSYVCVTDAKGNVFSATPSDTSFDTPVIPGTGLCPSSRGSQSWADPSIAAGVAPGKRPRLTPNPALAIGPDGRAIPFGTPGGDVQAQAMLQVFLNRVVFGMDVQAAVEAPRFGSHSFPDSFEPHGYLPGRLMLESRLPQALADGLAARGHDVQWWPDWTWRAGAVCLIDRDPSSGFSLAGADPRRASYALGW